MLNQWCLHLVDFSCSVRYDEFISFDSNGQIDIWASAWDFQQCGMCDQQRLRPACAYAQSDQSLCKSLEYSMSVKVLTKPHFEVLSLTGGCRGSSESTLVKMSNCWKSHAAALILISLNRTCWPDQQDHSENKALWMMSTQRWATIWPASETQWTTLTLLYVAS